LKPSFLRGLTGLCATGPPEPEEPIRSELFSIERLEQHAESLAAAQRITPQPGRGRPLAPRLRDNGRALLAAYRAIAAAIREERAITPAAEWLVDNFHIAEEQIREIRDDLPRGFYRQLPKLAGGPLAGYPRVFGISWAFVAHTDSLFDPQTLSRFVRAYQRVQPLTIGELWAVAITLRIVLVENLRRSAERIVKGRAARQEADALADRLLGVGNREAEPAETVLRGLDRTPLPANFAVQLLQRLRDQDPAVTPALRWLDDRLLAQGTTADEIVREEHQRQGAMNVTVRNVITSMRLMSAVDWAEFFESVSLVDAALRAGSDFAAMDFPTRDCYRHAIEALARGSGHSELTYQYSNFGVPGLGLKRGLSEDIVVAPYATALAAMVDAAAAAQNFSRLAAASGGGRYGCYEALDYTPARLPEGEPVAIVRAYMAHHQGMTVVAIANALHGGAMRARFHADAIVQATELLLQERTPRDVAVARPRAEEVKAASHVRELVPPIVRRFHSPHDPVPRTHLLSNGRYAVMLTGAGSGYSRWRDLAVTRWREDVTCDCWGTYIFLRDPRSGDVWSAGYQPSGVAPDGYAVAFSEDRAEISRRDGTITTTLEVAVSPEADAEVRRVSLSNLGSRAREIELTSYAEIVLPPPAADAAHPAFSKLFVHTEFVADVGTLLATRRPRSPADAQVWAAHLAVVEGESVGARQFETDRARFLGRGRGIRTPISVIDGGPLSNTVGTVLDPIFSLRCCVRLPPGATVRVAFWTLIAPSRSEALDLADKHHDATAFERVVTLAWTQAQVQLHHLGVGPTRHTSSSVSPTTCSIPTRRYGHRPKS
jgi:hypothetical protein